VQHDLGEGRIDAGWRRAAAELDAEIHDVDRAAVRIWLAFHPLALARAMEQAPDPVALAIRLQLRGRHRLAEDLEGAHAFLYGHRYWPQARQATLAAARQVEPVEGPLAAVIHRVASEAAASASADRELVTAIALVALATLQHVGLEALAATPGTVTSGRAALRRSPKDVLAARARDDRQGLFGFLRGERRIWSVTFDERDPAGRFPLTHTQAITTAAAEDRRDWRARDPRCTEGPIPVHCRSAACGTCWIGVLGGAEKLSPVEDRERRSLARFGYDASGDERPVVRLACQARATGAVSIVIPPWNGVFGALVPKDASTLVGVP
jgi:ferredoxin